MNVVCLKCNWTHFAVSREFAEKAVKEFNDYFMTLTPEMREQNYGNKGASMNQYERC